MVVPPETEPPADNGSTVTVVGDELAELQIPLVITALNCIVWAKTPEVKLVVVFAMSVQIENGLTEYCHLDIVPVCPERVSNPLVVPEQIVVPPLTAPPTDGGSTLTVVGVELAELHMPLVTTALN